MKETFPKLGMKREGREEQGGEGRGEERRADKPQRAPTLADLPQPALPHAARLGITLRTGSQRSRGSAPSLLAAPPS